ncbi:hypothetical protein BH20ACT9_BH20ACT9_06100 [soil metagenome]
MRHLAECVDALSGAETAERAPAHTGAWAAVLDAVRGRSRRRVRVARWRKAEPLGPVRIRYSARFFDGEQLRRERLERVVAAKLPGAWSSTWATRCDRVTFVRRAELPSHVEYAAVAGEGGPRALPLGMGLDGRVVTWRPDETPHMLIGGRTRKGKSSLERVLLVGWLRHGGTVMACDPKAVDLAWLAGRPGVLDVTTTSDSGSIAPMVATLRRATEDMAARYRQLRAAECDKWQSLAARSRPPPLLVAVDEAFDLLASSPDLSKPEQAQRSEALRHLRALAAKGAGAGVSVLVASQQPYAHVVIGSLRENLEGRVLLGHAREDQSRMVLDSDHGERVPVDAPRGRGVARLGSFVDLQVAWLAPTAVDDWVQKTGDSPEFCTPPAARRLHAVKDSA